MNLISTHDFNFHPLCVRWNTTLIFWLIHKCNVHTWFKHKHKSVMEWALPLMPFTKETAASLHAKPAKQKLHLSAQSSRRLNQGWSTAVIPGWASREERLSRSELYQLFRIDSDAVLHMNLIHWIRFGSCEVRRLNRALERIAVLIIISSRPVFLRIWRHLLQLSKKNWNKEN